MARSLSTLAIAMLLCLTAASRADAAWDKTVAAAEKEGSVVVNIPSASIRTTSFSNCAA